MISLFGAATQWLIMVLLGLPLALPIAVLSFFGGFIPYIGSAITTLLGFLVAVAVGDDPDIVIMFIFTIVFNIVQGNFVAPLVYGRAVSLHPAVVLAGHPGRRRGRRDPGHVPRRAVPGRRRGHVADRPAPVRPRRRPRCRAAPWPSPADHRAAGDR